MAGGKDPGIPGVRYHDGTPEICGCCGSTRPVGFWVYCEELGRNRGRLQRPACDGKWTNKYAHVLNDLSWIPIDQAVVAMLRRGEAREERKG